MCPKPLPDSFATARPSDAASGANTRVTPSPTPPVECLSTLGRVTPLRDSLDPEATMARVSSAVSRRDRPLTNAAIRNAAAR